MEPTLEEKLEVASSLILQSPPGEVNDVFNDVRPIVGDDGQLERGLLPALTQYNIEQLTLIEIPNSKLPAIICPAAQVRDPSDGNRYLDPHSNQTFTLDHLRLCANDIQPYQPENDQTESIRLELNTEAERYVRDHFPGGVWSVFNKRGTADVRKEKIQVGPQAEEAQSSLEENKSGDVSPRSEHTSNQKLGALKDSEETEIQVEKNDQFDKSGEGQVAPCEDSPSARRFLLYIVGNKYNPSNYWTGRWRSVYEIDLDSFKIQGEIQVDVHYYEQGNVQLKTRHTPMIDISPTSSSPQSVIKLIEKTEMAYQTALNLAYVNLGDQTFKQLRRTLPVTKQKINWSNIKSRIVLDEK